MDYRDHYKILGVAKNADGRELQTAHRTLARDYHPDANRGGETAKGPFKNVKDACEVRGDPVRQGYHDGAEISGGALATLCIEIGVSSLDREGWVGWLVLAATMLNSMIYCLKGGSGASGGRFVAMAFCIVPMWVTLGSGCGKLQLSSCAQSYLPARVYRLGY